MFSRSKKNTAAIKLATNTINNLEATKIKLGAINCNEAKERTSASFVGEVRSIRIVPRGQSYWLEIVIHDGTGKIVGWFFGKKSIAGMHHGTTVLFRGLVQLDEGEMTIANPYYEFI